MEDIHYHNMVMSVYQGGLLILATLLKALRLPLLVPKSSIAGQIMQSYTQADMVISAPGGPYFGDLYRGHEPVHWLFILIGKLYKKPIYLYAPSAGPFRSRIHNFFRRYIYKSFRLVICRETQSAGYIEKLVPSIKAIVTADSALQEKVTAEPDPILAEQLAASGQDIKTISISVLQYARLDKQQREKYEHAVLDAINYLDRKGEYQFVFLPQLYGGFHSDVEYMNSLVSRLPKTVKARVMDSEFDSDTHRMIVANSELVIASRYHPQIFSASARIPFIAICYQHKSSAFMNDIGMNEFAIDIFKVDSEKVINLVERSTREREVIIRMLEKGMHEKESLAMQTTKRVVKDFEDTLCI